MTKIVITKSKERVKKKLDTNTKQTITDAKSPVFHRINARWHAKKYKYKMHQSAKSVDFAKKNC